MEWKIQAVGGQYLREQYREATSADVCETLRAAASYLGERDVHVDDTADERVISVYTRAAWESDRADERPILVAIRRGR